MKEYIKIYSINVAAFLLMVGKVEPIIELDHTGQAYFLFPNTTEISFMIQVYRMNRVSVDLKDYLAAYREIRQKIRKIRNA